MLAMAKSGDQVTTGFRSKLPLTSVGGMSLSRPYAI